MHYYSYLLPLDRTQDAVKKSVKGEEILPVSKHKQYILEWRAKLLHTVGLHAKYQKALVPILKNKFQFARKLIKSNLHLNGCDEDSTHSLLEILPKIAFCSYNSSAMFWSNKIIFIGIFGSTLQCVSFFPFSPASLTELCSFCYGLKDLFPLIDDLMVLVLDRSKLMMSQAVDGTWAVAAVQRRKG